MEKATIIGVDLAKNVFQVHGAAADGTVLFRKKLTRLQFDRFMTERPAYVAAIESLRWGLVAVQASSEA